MMKLISVIFPKLQKRNGEPNLNLHVFAEKICKSPVKVFWQSSILNVVKETELFLREKKVGGVIL